MRVVDQPSIANVVGIFDHLSVVTLAEIAVLGFDASRARDYFVDVAAGVSSFALFDDETPIALFWHAPSEPHPSTYFVAAERFFDRYLPATLAMRRFLARYPHRGIRAHSMSPHPMAGRWLRAIGFELVEAGEHVQTFGLSA